MSMKISGKTYSGIFYLSDSEIFLIDPLRSGPDAVVFTGNLDEVLQDPTTLDRIPRSMRGSLKNFAIVPDHWFGTETYEFQSGKSALIDPFLERKLLAAHPNLTEIQNFFDYEIQPNPDGHQKIHAFYLKDPKGYQLSSLLDNCQLQPHRITTPAFLLREKLAQNWPKFQLQGCLLINLLCEDCHLFFFHRGQYLFSRSVALPNLPDKWEVLSYEINQSQYLFSQKAKAGLSRIFLLSSCAEDFEALSQLLDQEVVDWSDQETEAACVDTCEPHQMLSRLVDVDQLCPKTHFLGITHRAVKRKLEWWPVQLAGITVGVVLLLALMGESMFLSRLIKNEDGIRRAAIKRSATDGGHSLSQLAESLDRVIRDAQRPRPAMIIADLASAMPRSIKITGLDIDVERSPAVNLTAVARTEGLEQFQNLLSRMQENLNAAFPEGQPVKLNDIEFKANGADMNRGMSEYLIKMKVHIK